MAQAKFLQSGNPKGAARVSVDIPVGRYAALAVVVSGTTDTGQTLAIDDIGRIRLVRRGQQVQGETFGWYHRLANLWRGYPTAVTPTAGASRVVCYIPFALPGFPNTLDVVDKEEVDLYIDFDSVLDTRFGANSATYEVYGVMAPAVPETYQLIVREQDVQAAGAGRLEDTLNIVNLAALYVRDPAGVLDQVQLEIDGHVAVASISDDFLLDLTNLTNAIEASGNDLTEVYRITGTLEEAVNRVSTVGYLFNGAGTVETTVLGIDFGVDAAGSVQRVRAYLSR